MASPILKVVGASGQKTRIGTYILIGAGLLVVAAFFITYVERPQFDGTYCATAFWSNKVGFQIQNLKQQKDLVNIPKGAARICYKESIYENGWAQIEVETQRSYPDWVQAYAAGILEGSLTWQNIHNHWTNTISTSCIRDKNSRDFCEWLRELLYSNYVYYKALVVKLADHDHYWHQINLFFNQLEGLETGYIRGAKRSRSDLEEKITFSDFLLMNAAADIQDLKIYYENFILQNVSAATKEEQVKQTPKNFFLPSATMLTKISTVNNTSSIRQLFFAHSSAGSYSSMLRIQKRYKFHFHFSSDQRTKTVPGVDITFTGYPGILGSTDDFYVVKGRQVQSVVGGVGIKNENLKLWLDVNITNVLPLVARVMAANRIAQNRRTWAQAMARQPYTGAKQWITVDLNKLSVTDNLYNRLDTDDKHDDFPLSLNEVDKKLIAEFHNHNKSLVWIVEQLPGRMVLKDVTENFLAGNSTWVANGVPYFDEVLELSGISRDNFSADLTATADAELTNLEAVDKYLKLKGFRGDLLGDESIAYGNIDLKLFSYNARIGETDYLAYAGPIFMRMQQILPRTLTELQNGVDTERIVQPAAIGDERLSVSIEDAANLDEFEVITERRAVRNDIRALAMHRIGSGPFKWSEVEDKMPGVEHEGHPNEWNFDKITPQWAW